MIGFFSWPTLYIKRKSCLSVCSHSFLGLTIISLTTTRIEAISVPNEVLIWLHEVCCCKFLIALLCHPRRLQSLAVQENFTYIPVKTAATNAQLLACRTLTPEVHGCFSVCTFLRDDGSAKGMIICNMPPACTTGQVHMLVHMYYIKPT